MSYERTDEIRRKQSDTMKEKTKEYDWDSILEKRKKTITDNNIKVGRSKGQGGVKSGIDKICCVCGSKFYVIKSQIENRKTCSRECMRNNPDYIQKLKNIDRSYMNTIEYAVATRDPDRPKYKQYQRDVVRMTEKTYVENTNLINPQNYPRTLAGIEGGYQLDHIISIRNGYDNNMLPEEISTLGNLQMLPWRMNIVKGRK